ncbi:MAG: serine hydrolase, partial [Gemmatimonadota bacterium]|nr:serine hydrolase [Gemmatimonadota bacterium]
LDTILVLTGLEPRQLPASAILEQRMKELAALLPDWNGAEASGLFADNFFLDYRLTDLIDQSRRLFREAGQTGAVGGMVPVNQLRGTFILEGEHQNIEVFFTLTPERVPLIQEVRMRSVAR